MNYIKTKPLTNDEEVILLRAAKKGDRKAAEKLLCANYLFICKAAHKFKFLNSHQIDSQDLIQEGCIGFMKAIEKFREDKIGTIRFIAYAQFWVKEKIRQFIKFYLKKNNKFQFKIKIINESAFESDDIRLNKYIEKVHPVRDNPESLLAQCEKTHSINEVIDRFKSESKSVEKDIVEFVQYGEHKLADIARKHGISRQRVDQRKQKMYEKLKKMVLSSEI